MFVQCTQTLNFVKACLTTWNHFRMPASTCSGIPSLLHSQSCQLQRLHEESGHRFSLLPLHDEYPLQSLDQSYLKTNTGFWFPMCMMTYHTRAGVRLMAKKKLWVAIDGNSQPVSRISQVTMQNNWWWSPRTSKWYLRCGGILVNKPDSCSDICLAMCMAVINYLISTWILSKYGLIWELSKE